MANQEHLEILKNGVLAWNDWRTANRRVRPDLSSAELDGMSLKYCDLRRANLFRASFIETDLSGAGLNDAYIRNAHMLHTWLVGARANRVTFRDSHLHQANFYGAFLRQSDFRDTHMTHSNFTAADLSKADLRNADLSSANLNTAKLCGANLEGAELTWANLAGADLGGASLVRADLSRALLSDVNFQGANLSDCAVYGVSVWNANLQGATQANLRITSSEEPVITVDNLEVAQFIHLLLNNEKLRDVIDTITSKVVLILGRFTPERKRVLNAIRETLRRYDLLPVIFDFEIPGSRDTDEAVNLLARMARFVIADMTDARSIPQELKGIVESLPSVPIQPILQAGSSEYGMFDHIKKYPWVLPLFTYRDDEEIIQSIEAKIIAPVDAVLTRNQA